MSRTARPRGEIDRSRRGYSLIEMVTVISLLTAVLGLTTVILHRLIRAERSAWSALEESAEAARLGERFRDDAHQARAARVETSSDDQVIAILLEKPNGILTTYRLENDRSVTVSVSRTPAGEPNIPDARYSLARGGPPRVEILDDPAGQVAVLTIGDDAHPTTRVLRFAARIGLDRRPGPGRSDP